ncbi:MAG TPA: hypothetical protein VMW27_11215 [Thermoanaerobaculia bacterium]|nr:hypothetical protein [Thermoanaerobaculia bacterium]
MDITAKKITVSVHFDPTQTSPEDQFSFSVDGGTFQSTVMIPVHREVGLVFFDLQTVNSEISAEFPFDPIQWFSEMQPIPKPPNFLVDRLAAQEVVIVDFNNAEMTFDFAVSIVHQGNTFTSDEPTIINTPITGDS